ncbi:sensor histidine kinase YesM/ligand-binding sensor domain-containing protein [Dyadobacter sp. BE34]|uniref:Sensor histidine kinase YesM/ligand-binding sensor domain-containing protein n=1 Tax=Dyadobacter fermentans TaxID=94254 RepID=A0ABU1QYA0_9BACT|nr:MULTISPECIES: histidine kinase [Dyadobacter]MDR6805982.1 sensor histidine kinase YesM/ligand-binding sensor domain-containing protein [Dyadobacter fermentans]MDR7043722.1 sensor histidine kinase YesM/ligand-binding sensor domain-containing protein [Dyadobacter sp. BE242]MDR7198034.1 sensor histidine kinase YesM/ligand-binding sensor domain-containing protein [Dyadobacter sp. BE34]MDR7215996.1 sensor histidine kinase YesM/ligand-binding sensor domain-containing protein [Dyadobacter sp. BE31]
MKQFLILLLLLMCNVGHAQLPNITFEHISDAEGLPSRTVERAIEDKDGFMWFGTRKTLTRYDGYTFQNIGNKWVFGVATNGKGDIYYSSAAEKLLRVDPRSMKEHVIAGFEEGGGYNTFTDSFGDVWFSDRKQVNRYCPSEKKIYVYPLKQTSFIYHKGGFVEDKQRNVWVLGMEVGLFQFDRKANKLICKMGLDCPVSGEKYQYQMHGGIIDTDQKLWIAMAFNGLMKYDIRTGKVKIYKHGKFRLLSVCEGTDELGKTILWIGAAEGLGIFRPDTEQFSFFEGLGPRPFEVHDLKLGSKSNILWVCTSEGILKYDPKNQFIKASRIQGQMPANAMLQDRSDPSGQTFWIAVAYQGLYKFNIKTNRHTFFPFPQYRNTSETRWLIQDKYNKIWVGCNQWETWQDGKSDPSDNRFEGVFHFDPVSGHYDALPFDIHHTFFSVPFYSLGMIDSKGRFWITNHYEGIHIIDAKSNIEVKLWSDGAQSNLLAGGNWIMHIFEDSRSQIWLATYQGIFLFDESARSFRRVNDKYGFMQITEGPDGNIWAVGWSGVVSLDSSGRTLKSWSGKDGLYDLECRQVVVDSSNRVWVGTFDGLHVLDEKRNHFRRFTVNDGLLSNNTMVSVLLAGDDKLLVGNLGGWNILDLKRLDKTGGSGNIRLTNVRVNNRESIADWSKPVALKSHENAVSFSFSALNFRKANDNNYSYYLEGFEKKWIDAAHAHQAFYTNLTPGQYTFHARLTGVASGSELSIPFTITPAFYQTIWFRVLSLLLVAGVVGVIYRSQLSYQKMKARLALEELEIQQKEIEHKAELVAYQLKLSEMEMSSLRSQMNPHFIFNCLNSIQFFTAQNDGERASEYLGKFSRLIRLVLENSKSDQVTLDNELETLRLYVEMESMRFSGKFQFEMHVDQHIETHAIQIPPLLLQPFVENAIWHGLMHKEAGGTVALFLNQPHDHLLRVIIQDDGIGRQKASEYKSKSATKNKSYGMKITADRIKMISQPLQVRTSVEVIDIKDRSGNALGTRVILNIPV